MAVELHPGQSSPVDGISYVDLYRRWEQHGHWRATSIDFTEDVAGWAGLSEMQRKSAVWLYSMFLAGEGLGRRQRLPRVVRYRPKIV